MFCVCVGNHIGKRRHAVRADGLKAGQLGFHDGHKRCDRIDDIAAKSSKQCSEFFWIGDGCSAEGRGQGIAFRIEADAGRSAAIRNGCDEPVGERNGVCLRGGRRSKSGWRNR